MNDSAPMPASPFAVDAEALRARRSQWVDLLADAVTGGASVGFVLPPDRDALAAFWDGIADDIARGERVVYAVERGGRIVGSVQVAPCLKPNGRHRAEIQKLVVLSTARGCGIARTLMAAAEAHAARAGWWLLVLDTREDSTAELLYRKLGWNETGRVPDYARDPDRTLATCVFFWKRLEGTR